MMTVSGCLVKLDVIVGVLVGRKVAIDRPGHIYVIN
jgi:hypothetical protein